MLVEAGGAVVDGMRDDGADGELVRGEHGSAQRVPQEEGADAASLMAAVDSEACNDRDRNREVP